MTEQQKQYLINSYNQVFKTGFPDFDSIERQVKEDSQTGKKRKAYALWFELLLKFDYEGFYTYIWNYLGDFLNHGSLYEYIKKSGKEIQQLYLDYSNNSSFIGNKDSYFGSFNQTPEIKKGNVIVACRYIWNEAEDDCDDETEQSHDNKFDEYQLPDSIGINYESFYFSLYETGEEDKEDHFELGRVSFNHLDYSSNDNFDNDCYDLTFGYNKSFLDDKRFIKAIMALISKAFNGGILKYEMGEEEKGDPKNKYLICKAPFSMITYHCLKDDDHLNELALKMGFIHDYDGSLMNQKHEIIKVSHYYLINPKYQN